MHISRWAPSLVVSVSLISSANAHSWLEQLSNVKPDGSFDSPVGYPRGYISQYRPGAGNPVYDALPPWADDTMVWLLPPNGVPTGNAITDDMTMCRPSQQKSVQTNGFPVLNTSPGSTIAVQYQENGHTTQAGLNGGKPSNGGTVYIYGTADPKPDDKFNQIHKVWNADGTGGDKRGKLIATRDFDDGQCHQISDAPTAVQRNATFPVLQPTAPQGAQLWCQNNFQLPEDMPVGKLYTLYWVWDWPTYPGFPIPPNTQAGQTASTGTTVAKLQYYTTCSDVQVAAPANGDSNKALKAENLKVTGNVPNRNQVGIMSQLTGNVFLGSMQADVPQSATQAMTASGTSLYAVASAPAATTPSSPPPAASAPSSQPGKAAAGPPTSVVMVTVTPTITVQPSQTGVTTSAATTPLTRTTLVVVTIYATTTEAEAPPTSSGSAVAQAASSTQFTLSGDFFQTQTAPDSSAPTATGMMPSSGNSSSNCSQTKNPSKLFGSGSGNTNTPKRGSLIGAAVKAATEIEDKFHWKRDMLDDVKKVGHVAVEVSNDLAQTKRAKGNDFMSGDGLLSHDPNDDPSNNNAKRGSLVGAAVKVATEIEDKIHLKDRGIFDDIRQDVKGVGKSVKGFADAGANKVKAGINAIGDDLGRRDSNHLEDNVHFEDRGLLDDIRQHAKDVGKSVKGFADAGAKKVKAGVHAVGDALGKRDLNRWERAELEDEIQLQDRGLFGDIRKDAKGVGKAVKGFAQTAAAEALGRRGLNRLERARELREQLRER